MVVRMGEWWSIEVFHGEFPAQRWRESYSDRLVEAALTNGATSWQWHEHQWGVVFEVEFEDETRWEVFRALPVVQGALDAVPDPVNGLIVYRGRGGGAGATSPRHPKPVAGAGAMSLPEPDDEPFGRLTATGPADPYQRAGAATE
jgi:hypothetical protein